jgi:hypothetical protein
LGNTRSEAKRARAALTALGDAAPGRALDLRRAERLVRDQAAQARRDNARGVPPVTTIRDLATVAHADIRALPVPRGSADLVLTDPDYTRAGVAGGAFEDLAEMAAIWLRPGGLLVTYCGQMHLPHAIASLSGSGLAYWWMLAALHDTGSGVAQVRPRAIGNAFKPLLVFRQPGGQDLPPWSLDVIRGTGRCKDTGHPWEQAQSEAEQIITTFTQPGHLVVDPYAGSGTTAAAAVATLRRTVTGDVDEIAVQMTRERLSRL